MKQKLTRRSFLSVGPLLSFTGGIRFTSGSEERGQEGAAKAEQPAVHDMFPTQEPELVREMVTVSHGNYERVRELVESRPSLARAAWDWGFGDWETALGAASHMGNRPIAEYLIANGARPSMFSAAMLGQLEVVKAFVSASPGVQGVRGPHGITLLAHARAGGDAAGEVVKYLEALGGADPRPYVLPLPESDIARLVGTYVFGPGENDRLEVAESRGQLTLARKNGTPRALHHLGSSIFFPAGAEAVRIRFTVEGNPVCALTVHDPDLVLTARQE